MGIPHIIATGSSGLNAAKTGIATSGHNISNANTEGFSRQRVQISTAPIYVDSSGKSLLGTGAQVSRIERLNDEYIEKQIRNSYRELSNYEEREVILRQIETVFNEMNEDGLSVSISKFFNEFRKLAQDPESLPMRESLRQVAQSMTHEFHRIRKSLVEAEKDIGKRISECVNEANAHAKELSELNDKIKCIELSGASANDLLDKQDLILKKMSALFDLSAYKDASGNLNVSIKGIGPWVIGSRFESLSCKGNDSGSSESQNDYGVFTTGSASGLITHVSAGSGKIGTLLEMRREITTPLLKQLDEMAFTMQKEVNAVHEQGVTKEGFTRISFFTPLSGEHNAAEALCVSKEVQSNIDFIASSLKNYSSSDNRVLIKISQLQHEKFFNEKQSTFSDWYDSLVSDVGLQGEKNHSAFVQQKDIVTQLSKLRDETSGVSVDEETAQLLQYQHAYDASAKVIQVADEMLKTVLALKRD